MSKLPIGNATTPFTGHLDGNGHSIQNLSIDQSGKQTGLLRVAKNATIKNMKISGATISAGSMAGTVLGQGVACTLSNISLDEYVVNGTGFVGGFKGRYNRVVTYASSAVSSA